MKLKNRLPLKIRQTEYVEGEELKQLIQIVHKQNILINHLLQQTVIKEEVPSHPAGVYADKMSFEEWFNTSGDILEGIKEGEIVIVYDRWKDTKNQILAFRDEIYEHCEKVIYVCQQDSPTREEHFSKLETTIGKHKQIINNFMNRK